MYNSERLISQALADSNRLLIVFLDYDGTLCNLVDNPEKAYLNASMAKTMRALTLANSGPTNFPVTVISGRSREKLINFLTPGVFEEPDSCPFILVGS